MVQLLQLLLSAQISLLGTQDLSPQEYFIVNADSPKRKCLIFLICQQIKFITFDTLAFFPQEQFTEL